MRAQKYNPKNAKHVGAVDTESGDGCLVCGELPKKHGGVIAYAHGFALFYCTKCIDRLHAAAHAR